MTNLNQDPFANLPVFQMENAKAFKPDTTLTENEKPDAQEFSDTPNQHLTPPVDNNTNWYKILKDRGESPYRVGQAAARALAFFGYGIAKAYGLELTRHIRKAILNAAKKHAKAALQIFCQQAIFNPNFNTSDMELQCNTMEESIRSVTNTIIEHHQSPTPIHPTQIKYPEQEEDAELISKNQLIKQLNRQFARNLSPADLVRVTESVAKLLDLYNAKENPEYTLAIQHIPISCKDCPHYQHEKITPQQDMPPTTKKRTHQRRAANRRQQEVKKLLENAKHNKQPHNNQDNLPIFDTTQNNSSIAENTPNLPQDCRL